MSTPSEPAAAATAEPAVVAASATVRTGGRRKTLAPLALIAPAIVLFCLFFLWPGGLGLVFSFTDYRGVGDLNFIGLENYLRLLADSTFYSALLRTFLYTALMVPTLYVVSLFIAWLLASSAALGKGVARVIFFVPWLISPIVIGVIYRWLFGENFGFVNFIIGQLGGSPLQWQTDATLALLLIIIAGTWGATAFNMLLFIAAIRNIPRSYLEAAQLDGANSAQRFFRITLPLLAPTSFMVVLLSTIGAMKEFALIQALNGGGPGTQNTLMVQYIYRTGFERADIGYASAASMVLMVILVVIALIQMRFDRKSALS